MTVSVDNDFARFGAKSYAINKITSVEIREVKDTKGGCAIVLFGLLSLGCALAALGSVASNFGGAIGYVLVAALFGYITYTLFLKSKRITYQLFLITAASEQQAYESLDRDDVYGLRSQVEAAMLHHSRGMNSVR